MHGSEDDVTVHVHRGPEAKVKGTQELKCKAQVSQISEVAMGSAGFPFRPWWALAWSFAGSYKQNVRGNFIS